VAKPARKKSRENREKEKDERRAAHHVNKELDRRLRNALRERPVAREKSITFAPINPTWRRKKKKKV